MRMQIEVWAVSNLTFVLLRFTILNSTTKVPFKVLALYTLRYGTLKRVNGYANGAVGRLRKMDLKHNMTLQTLYITRNDCTHAMKQYGDKKHSFA